MRITRYKDINEGGYTNPATEARAYRREMHAIGQPVSRAAAYRKVINELFTPYVFPGGYNMLFTDDHGDCFCADCAKRVFFDEREDVTVDVYEEGPSMYCDECGVEIESAYGDPEEEAQG